MRIDHISLPELQAFCSLVELGSFTRAADWLALSNSAFSRRISRLEAGVGGQLFARDTRNLQLTALGRDFYYRIGPLLKSLDQNLQRTAQLARGEAGSLSIACLTSVAYSLLPVAVEKFRRIHPLMRVDVWDGNAIPVREFVRERRVELAVGMWWEDDDLVYEALIDDPFVLACPTTHPLANAGQASWEQISQLRLTSLRSSSGNRQMLDSFLKAKNLQLDWFDEVESFSTLMGFIEHGQHLALLPKLALAVARNIAIVQVGSPQVSRKICLLRQKDQPLSTPAETMWRCIQETLAEVKS